MARSLFARVAQPIRQNVICSIYPDGAPWDKPLPCQLSEIGESAAAGSPELGSVAHESISAFATAGPNVALDGAPPSTIDPGVTEGSDLPIAGPEMSRPMSRREFAEQIRGSSRVSSKKETIETSPLAVDDLEKRPGQVQSAPPPATPIAAASDRDKTNIGRIGFGLTAIAVVAGAIVARRC